MEPRQLCAIMGGFLLLLLVGCSAWMGVETTTEIPLTSTSPVPSLTPVSSIQATDVVEISPSLNYCLNCHVDQEQLRQVASAEEVKTYSMFGTGCENSVELEPWEKYLVDQEIFPTSIHGLIPCTDCHGGMQNPNKEAAHSSLNPNPSQGPKVVCVECHPNMVTNYSKSLHITLTGFKKALEVRGGAKSQPALETMFGFHCSDCHATCGDCHVSQPAVVGGGLFNGHNFEKTPPMVESCASCHGCQLGNEYLGKHTNLPADVHFSQGGMTCMDCHSGQELHGELDDCSTCHSGPEGALIPPVEHRYDGMQVPRCETCHATVTTGQDQVEMHKMHGAQLSCQVCHSISYVNCYGCHVALDQSTNQPVFDLDSVYLTFLIGRNNRQSYDRPYSYVPVRHIPVTPDSFIFYGENLLPNFTSLPTWVYATPHNIQRNTPQNASCAACHGNSELFLTIDKINQEEWQVNQGMIIDVIPASLSEMLHSPALPISHAGRTVCLICHQNGIDGPLPPVSHARYLDSGCLNCHTSP